MQSENWVQLTPERVSLGMITYERVNVFDRLHVWLMEKIGKGSWKFLL